MFYLYQLLDKISFRLFLIYILLRHRHVISLRRWQKLCLHSILRPSQAEDFVTLLPFLSTYGRNQLHLIDIGANIGQFTLDFRKYIFNLPSTCFEPVPATFEILKSRFDNCPNTILFNLGVSSMDQTLKFHIYSDNTLNSLYNYDAALTTSDERSHPFTSLDVHTRPLQHDDSISRRIFLKIDVQGMEVDTLEGCSKLLPLTDFVLIETSFASEYEGSEPSFPYLCKYLLDYGLLPAYFQSYGVTSQRPLCYERDVLFVRTSLLPSLLF